jgi:hypothetical protein
MLRRYRAGLPHERQLLLDRYTLTDVALKVVGVGSVGTRCGIALFMSGKGDPLFLQFKEARASVLEAYAGKAPFKHAGKRVVFCQKLMQAASDMFLGATTGAEGKQFYVRQLRDAKVSPAVEVMNADNLIAFAKACGWALARAHKRSGDAVMLSGYLGRSDAFEDGGKATWFAAADSHFPRPRLQSSRTVIVPSALSRISYLVGSSGRTMPIASSLDCNSASRHVDPARPFGDPWPRSVVVHPARKVSESSALIPDLVMVGSRGAPQRT